MKKGFLLLSMIAITYLLTTTIYSYFFGLPPFNYGITVGYPTIYYSFRVSPIETQYGSIKLSCSLSLDKRWFIFAFNAIFCLKSLKTARRI